VIVARDVPHEHTHLTVVDLTPVATPLTLRPHREGASFGEAAGIKGDNAIGLTQPIDHLCDQHLDHETMLPQRCADELLQDQALDSDQRRDVLGILARQVRQQPLEVEVHIALAGFRLKSVLIGHHEVTQALNHVVEDIRGNDAIPQ
jgi:hypothetical protein